MKGDADVVIHAERGEEADVLKKCVGDAASGDAVGFLPGDGFALILDSAGAGLVNAGDDVENRGLAPAPPLGPMSPTSSFSKTERSSSETAVSPPNWTVQRSISRSGAAAVTPALMPEERSRACAAMRKALAAG